jgi:uncharacterized protein (TIGR02594 family)
MAAKKQTDKVGLWIKSDEISLDTSKSPWMQYAKAELEKQVHELAADDEFISSTRTALMINARMQAISRQIEDFGNDSMLLRGKTAAVNTSRYNVLSKNLKDPTQQLLGKMEADRLRQRNPEISKYFDGLKTAPDYDKKGRSFDIASTYKAGGYGQITAWCAAFVNWCLSQAGAPHLGYATAKSWLEFGTPVAHPVYGCVTVIKPSSSTGSTTGHVAFFVEFQGNKVKLLGGNQVHGTRVSESLFKESDVFGYRWPTKINHYLLATAGVLT